MIGTKLNAQVIIKNLQNMHAKSLRTGRPGPPTGARGRMEQGPGREYQDWARLQGRGPHTAGGPKDRPLAVGWRMW
jgi:hypothetical protein